MKHVYWEATQPDKSVLKDRHTASEFYYSDYYVFHKLRKISRVSQENMKIQKFDLRSLFCVS